MNETNEIDDDAWCPTQREIVVKYLSSQGVKHGRIGDWPAWHITGCVAVWAIESHAYPESIGWWVITGDLPTDYCSAADIVPPQHPRKSIQVISDRWSEDVKAWRRGEHTPGFPKSASHSPKKLMELLEVRVRLLQDIVADESLWEG